MRVARQGEVGLFCCVGQHLRCEVSSCACGCHVAPERPWLLGIVGFVAGFALGMAVMGGLASFARTHGTTDVVAVPGRPR